MNQPKLKLCCSLNAAPSPRKSDLGENQRHTKSWRIGFSRPGRFAQGVCLFGLFLESLLGCKPQPAQPTSNEPAPPVQSPIDASESVTDASATPVATSQTPLDQPVAKPNDVKKNVLIDRTVPIVDENGVTFVPAQLHKNNSLLVLAFESDIRADFVVMTARTILNAEQLARAKQMALSYEDQFQDLERQRAAILETASDEKEIDRQVLKVQMKLAMLLRQIRMRINEDIMTPAQRDESHRLYLEKMAEKKQKEEEDARKQAAMDLNSSAKK